MSGGIENRSTDALTRWRQVLAQRAEDLSRRQALIEQGTVLRTDFGFRVRSLKGSGARQGVLGTAVDVGSELNYETVSAIREIRDAARAITDLATLVQRQPNALILGK